MNICLHFWLFFLPVSAALSWVFALLLLPDGPKSRQVRRFFFLGGGELFAARNAFVATYLGQTRRGTSLLCPLFWGGVLGSSVPRKNKKKQKEKKKEKKKILRRRRRFLFLRRKQEKEEEARRMKKKKKKKINARRRTRKRRTR